MFLNYIFVYIIYFSFKNIEYVIISFMGIFCGFGGFFGIFFGGGVFYCIFCGSFMLGFFVLDDIGEFDLF